MASLLGRRVARTAAKHPHRRLSSSAAGGRAGGRKGILGDDGGDCFLLLRTRHRCLGPMEQQDTRLRSRGGEEAKQKDGETDSSPRSSFVLKTPEKSTKKRESLCFRCYTSEEESRAFAEPASRRPFYYDSRFLCRSSVFSSLLVVSLSVFFLTSISPPAACYLLHNDFPSAGSSFFSFSSYPRPVVSSESLSAEENFSSSSIHSSAESFAPSGFDLSSSRWPYQIDSPSGEDGASRRVFATEFPREALISSLSRMPSFVRVAGDPFTRLRVSSSLPGEADGEADAQADLPLLSTRASLSGPQKKTPTETNLTFYTHREKAGQDEGVNNSPHSRSVARHNVSLDSNEEEADNADKQDQEEDFWPGKSLLFPSRSSSKTPGNFPSHVSGLSLSALLDRPKRRPKPLLPLLLSLEGLANNKLPMRSPCLDHSLQS